MTETLSAGARSSLSAIACSPAKINLTLEVLGRRPDGYHDIRSLVVGLGLSDTLRFEASTDGRLVLSCNRNDLPTDEGNLIVQSARLLRARAGNDSWGARIELTKRIPVAAGLGGGSSNAAAALTALNALWRAELSVAELSRIGQRVGSDVPLFFSLPSSVISGRGEIVDRVSLRWSGWALLCWASEPVHTAEVYARWRESDASARRPAARTAAGGAAAPVEATTADEVSARCFNDLEPAVFRVAPAVRTLWEAVGGVAGAEPRVSGAGRTVFVLFDDRVEADGLAERLNATGIGQGTAVVRLPAGPSTTNEDDR